MALRGKIMKNEFKKLSNRQKLHTINLLGMILLQITGELLIKTMRDRA